MDFYITEEYTNGVKNYNVREKKNGKIQLMYSFAKVDQGIFVVSMIKTNPAIIKRNGYYYGFCNTFKNKNGIDISVFYYYQSELKGYSTLFTVGQKIGFSPDDIEIQKGLISLIRKSIEAKQEYKTQQS